jgi:hypothetical protein
MVNGEGEKAKVRYENECRHRNLQNSLRHEMRKSNFSKTQTDLK